MPLASLKHALAAAQKISNKGSNHPFECLSLQLFIARVFLGYWIVVVQGWF